MEYEEVYTMKVIIVGGDPLLCALLGLAVTGLTVLPAMAGTPKPTKTE